MNRQDENQSNPVQGTLNRRQALKTGLVTGIAALGLLGGVHWIPKAWRSLPRWAAGMGPSDLMAANQSLPVPPLDGMMPASTQTATFAMG